MTTAEQLAVICQLADSFRDSDKAIRDVVRASPYETLRAQVTATEVATFLRDRPQLIARWVAYSEDKRTSSGWYLSGAPSWSVGYIHGDGRRARDVPIGDPALACATFILHELDSIQG